MKERDNDVVFFASLCVLHHVTDNIRLRDENAARYIDCRTEQRLKKGNA